PDGIVDPDQRTINRLNVLAFPEVDALLIAKGRAALATVALYVSRTLMHLHMAEVHYLMPGGGTLVNFSSHAKVLNDHFHLQRSTTPLRDIGQIRGVYQLMQTATAHIPRGPNQRPAFGFIDAVPSDSTAELTLAYAFAGGYLYRQGQSGLVKGDTATHRFDMVYLTRLLL